MSGKLGTIFDRAGHKVVFGNPHPRYSELLELVARQKLRPSRLITREISLNEVTDTLRHSRSRSPSLWDPSMAASHEAPRVIYSARIPYRPEAPPAHFEPA